MNAKRVLIVQTRQIASVTAVNHMIAEGLVNRGHEVTYLYLEKGEAITRARALFNLHLRKQDYAGTRRVAKKALKAFFKTYCFDVILTNMYKPTELIASLHDYLGEAHCYGSFCAFGDFDRWTRRFAFRLKNRSRFEYISISDALKDYLINAQVGITQSNCHCIPLAIDTATINSQALSMQEARSALGLPSEDLIVGTIGRLVGDKQQDALIRAFALIAPNYPDVQLAIVGEGEKRQELENLAKTLGVESRTHFLGAKVEARRYIKAFDLFVFPSKSEGFGLALLEAMALARPIIINKIEPLTTILDDAGLQVDVTQARQFADKLEELLTMTLDRRQGLGEKARVRAQSHYSLAEFNRAYSCLVEAAPAPDESKRQRDYE